MAPRYSQLASCGDDRLRRRSSVARNSLQVLQAIDEEFAKFDKDGDGILQKDEILACLRGLTTLDSPANDVDCICAALDKDMDGSVSKQEFTEFVMAAVTRFEEQHKDLDIEEILRVAFKEVIEQGRQQRDIVIEAFMTSSHEIPRDLIKGSKWMHEAFDELYQAPVSQQAPVYQAGRADFLKESLQRTIDECDNPRVQKPTLISRSLDSAPDKGTFKAFCSLWLKKITALESRAVARR